MKKTVKKLYCRKGNNKYNPCGKGADTIVATRMMYFVHANFQ